MSRLCLFHLGKIYHGIDGRSMVRSKNIDKIRQIKYWGVTKWYIG